MEQSLDRIMTVTEVATYLQMSKSKVYYLIQRREIPHIKIGRNVRIRQSDLENWLTRQLIGMLSLVPSERAPKQVSHPLEQPVLFHTH